MLAVLSPSKTLDYETAPQTAQFTEPHFLDQSQQLIDVLRDYDAPALGKLMSISDKLSDLNVGRVASFETPFTPSNAKQALLAFKGDVYRDFELDAYDEDDFAFAQQHLRILSGLYGLLRPLDLMQPYRLEMGTKLPTARGKDLYEFWGSQIAAQLRQALDAQGDDILLNLASNEYFNAVDTAALGARVVNVNFLEQRNGTWKSITFNLKRARGTITNWVIRNRINDVEALKEFAEDRYYYSPERSTPEQHGKYFREIVFLRHPA